MRERLLAAEKVTAIRWTGERLQLLDQRLLPLQEVWLDYDSAAGVAVAIRDMVVRGAPLIGATAAYGLALALRADADAVDQDVGVAAGLHLLQPAVEMLADLDYSVFDADGGQRQQPVFLQIEAGAFAIHHHPAALRQRPLFGRIRALLPGAQPLQLFGAQLRARGGFAERPPAHMR